MAIQAINNRLLGKPDWPPPALKDHWLQIEDYRRRLHNNIDEMMMYTPYFNISSERSKSYTPVPLVREIASFSADLMFSQPAKITHDQAQTPLDDILEANGFDPFLQDAAHTVAVEGRGALRVQFDDDLALAVDVPIIDFIPEDQIMWEMKYQRFVKAGTVVITRQSEDKQAIYRLFERHERGLVTRTLYRGKESYLGTEVKLSSYPEFQDLLPAEETGVDTLTLIRWDNVPGGRSDIWGMDTLLDRINEEYSRGTIKSRRSNPVTFVDRELADERGEVELDGVILTGGGNLLDPEGAARMVETTQPDMQVASQIQWIDYLLDSGLLFMGYSKASYGRDEGGSADSGKALKLRQARTLLKRAGKERMAREAIQTALSVALAMQIGATSVQDLKPEVEFGLGLPDDDLETAQELSLLLTAGAISTLEAVRRLHPEWEEDAVQEEVARIEDAHQADALGAAIQKALPGSRTVPGSNQPPGVQGQVPPGNQEPNTQGAISGG